MPKRWSSKDVDRLLRQHGFVLVSQKGSHLKYLGNGRTVIVPAGRDPLPHGTFGSILRQSGLDISQFD